MKVFIAAFILLFSSIASADRVRLLAEDQDALQARVDLVQQAKHEILAEYFSVWNDDQSVGAFALLLDAARRGIKVKIVMDALSNTVPKSFFTTLLEHAKDAQGNVNIEIKLYNPPSLNLLKITHRDHSKMLIVDGKRMITGGRNIGDKYFGLNKKRNFSDIDILLDGKAVTQAREDFLSVFNSDIVKDAAHYRNLPTQLMLEKCEKALSRDEENCIRRRDRMLRAYRESLARIEENLKNIMEDTPTSIVRPNTGRDWLEDTPDGADIEFISHQPDEYVSKETAHLTHAFEDMISKTQTDLNILSPYLVPTKNMYKLFEDLIQRGVRVRIVTNSLSSTDNLFAQAGYLNAKKKLIKMGIELYEFNGPDTSHGKAAIIDNKVAFVGTYNLDPRSAYLNREVGIFVNSSPNNKIVLDLEAEIEAHRMNSLLVGKDGEIQNLDEQKRRRKELSKTKRGLLKFIQLFVPLFRSQI